MQSHGFLYHGVEIWQQSRFFVADRPTDSASVGCFVDFCMQFAHFVRVLYQEVQDGAQGYGCCVAAGENLSR